MSFNSIAFAFFLPIVFLIYWRCARRVRLRNLFIIAASYLFYGWWDWRFLLLIAFTTACSYGAGLLLDKTSRPPLRRAILWTDAIINLGILATFKYFNFFVLNFSRLVAPFGWEIGPVTANLILPVGISFYTFQALSYVIDVYRRKIEATRDAAAFFAFISFFPQLVAGPIERATNLLPQFKRKISFDYAFAVDGCRLMLWGFFKKLLVADNCALLANQIFENYSSMGGADLWLGALAFTFQIYGDFSGYSDIAIGTAQLFGIRLMRNFRTPYFSRDPAEFWRRWHISLNKWFIDYVYIPLGGSRRGKARTVSNTFTVFLLSGLWHGASWSFVAWGGYHAILMLPQIIAGKTRVHTDTVATSRRLPSMREATYMALTFLLVAIGWVLFRSGNMHIAAGYIHRMVTDFSYVDVNPNPFLPVWILIMLLVEWVGRRKEHPFAISGHGLLRYRAMRLALYIVITILILTYKAGETTFIYFQF